MKLPKEQISKIREVLESFEDIEFSFVFGSYARGNANELSDIDIAIFQDEKKSKYDYIMREFEVETKLLKQMPSKKFDVRTLNIAPIVVVGKILNEGMLIFVRDEKFLNEFVERNRLKYMDYMIIYKPLLEKRYLALIND